MRELQAVVQGIYAPVELGEVHIAEAQAVKKIGIIRILSEELLQANAGLVQSAGGEELEGTGEGSMKGEVEPHMAKCGLVDYIVYIPCKSSINF